MTMAGRRGTQQGGRLERERRAGVGCDVEGVPCATARVHDLRLPELICGWEDEDVTDALALMRARNLAALLVLDREGGVVGWVTVEARSGHGGCRSTVGVRTTAPGGDRS